MRSATMLHGAVLIANLRELDWQSLGMNFVLVYSPSASAARR